MSVAFTREESAETAAEIELPDRPISPHPNLVTQHGYDALASATAAAREAYAASQQVVDLTERRKAAALASRDLEYLLERLRSAQIIPAPTGRDLVVFGSRVSFRRGDGRLQVFRIVGEDEANPSGGSVSYVSPIARALMAKAVGDVVNLSGQEIEILAID